MSIYLAAEKQSRFNQLITLFASGDISDEQEAELLLLRKELKSNKAERIELIAELKNQIAKLHVPIDELYSKAEILSSAQAFGLVTKVTVKKSLPGNRNDRTSDSNEVLLILSKEPGESGPTDWKYRQGRVYERTGRMATPWQHKQYPAKLLNVGYSAESLRPYFTPAGVAFFATEAGQAELAVLVEATNKARSANGSRESME